MDKYFVIGHPVKHSLSPEIHKMFAAQFDIEMSYETRDFEPGGSSPRGFSQGRQRDASLQDGRLSVL